MRFKYCIACSVILFGLLSEAKIYIWPIELKARGERNEDQNLELKSNQLPSFGASYTFDRFMLGLDIANYENESENGNVLIETKYSDVIASAGYSLFSGEIWDFYAVASAGVYQQKVETSVGGGAPVSNKSNDKGLVGMGAEYFVRTPFYFSAVVGGRLHWTQDLDPEIMPEIYIKLGAGF